jgi:hypothetical protein
MAAARTTMAPTTTTAVAHTMTAPTTMMAAVRTMTAPTTTMAAARTMTARRVDMVSPADPGDLAAIRTEATAGSDKSCSVGPTMQVSREVDAAIASDGHVAEDLWPCKLCEKEIIGGNLKLHID